jgi:hypothetical protein
MGLQKVPCNIGTEDGHFTEGYEHPRVNVPIIPSGMKYKYSWDWLMPVVEKIEQVNEGVPPQLLDINLFSSIDEVYQAVIEFIESYDKE